MRSPKQGSQCKVTLWMAIAADYNGYAVDWNSAVRYAESSSSSSRRASVIGDCIYWEGRPTFCPGTLVFRSKSDKDYFIDSQGVAENGRVTLRTASPGEMEFAYVQELGVANGCIGPSFCVHSQVHLKSGGAVTISGVKPYKWTILVGKNHDEYLLDEFREYDERLFEISCKKRIAQDTRYPVCEIENTPLGKDAYA